MFTSNLNTHPGTGPYAGRWIIRNDKTQEIVSDFATKELADKALPGIRKYARERAAAMDLPPLNLSHRRR